MLGKAWSVSHSSAYRYKWFQEVEEMALTGSEISEKDYENILMDKYKQQGLIL
ncbi:hypothetical protein myaer87_22010 [Microcystis aeruginosa NIES-87]|uniref:hypothetical protein n=1 Tax=Microcystis sp. M169S2 TaxID=2771157 RepID=UPI000CBE47ED|nr:hypothetical protein [Microcystis sp. M169S2]GBE74974.1 hypothetical protein myaer87_22010 [Microcystis aeruginosa NIES-87]